MIQTTVVAIISSPRKDGNSSTIVKAMTDAAKENGKDVKEYYLNSMKDVMGCQACMGCKRVIGCVQKDDLSQVLRDIRDAESVIISTPLYFNDSCGQLRLLQDRFYSFIDMDFKPNIAPGKKIATVVTCGSDEKTAKAVAAKVEGVMTGFGFVPAGTVVLAGGPPDTAKHSANALAAAKEIGKKL